MEWQMVDAESAGPRAAAAEYLSQAERCLSAGHLSQAKAFLVQAWATGEQCDSDLASTAAWGVAWLLTHMGLYDQAAEWFQRVVVPPSSSTSLWVTTMRVLDDVLRVLTASPPGAAAGDPSPALPLLEIRTLGRFQVIRGGAALPACKARKAIALLRYLLTQHHRSAHKEELMELLWPEARPREAAHSLHVAVNALRRYVDPPGGSYLLFEAGYYTVSPDAPLTVDCDSFEQQIDAAERDWRAGELAGAEQGFRQAIACYQGDYYIDSHDLAWAVVKRERLLSRYLAALDHLGRIYFNQRRFEQAAECYQRLLERDGYREDVHCQLMHCYSGLGRRREALEQYRRCSSILSNDLGLMPMQETQAVYRAIAGAGV